MFNIFLIVIVMAWINVHKMRVWCLILFFMSRTGGASTCWCCTCLVYSLVIGDSLCSFVELESLIDHSIKLCLCRLLAALNYCWREVRRSETVRRKWMGEVDAEALRALYYDVAILHIYIEILGKSNVVKLLPPRLNFDLQRINC
jgi:hypothetical protein